MLEELRAIFGLRDEDEVVALGLVFLVVLLVLLFFMRGCRAVAPFVGTDAAAVAEVVSARPLANRPIVPTHFTGGPVTFSGSYLPEKNLTVLLDGQVIGTTRTDQTGRWTFAHRINRAGRYNLQVRDENNAGTLLSSPDYPFVVENEGVVGSASVTNTPIIQRVETGSALPAAIIPAVGAGGVPFSATVVVVTKVVTVEMPDPTNTVVQATGVPTAVPPTPLPTATMIPATATPQPTPEPTLEPTTVPRAFSAEFTPIDDSQADIATTVSGTGPAGATVQIWRNDEIIGETVIDADGNWRYDIVQALDPGEHQFKAILLADSGDIAEESPNTLAVVVETPPAVAEGNGQLAVDYVLADGDAGDGVADGAPIIHFIFDASWSMRVAIDADDTSRIGIAKEALRGVVEELPAGVPVSMRVFGNIEGNYACRTDLMRPVQPLDREQFLTEIEDVYPIWNANTPIAASLAKVQEDLAGVNGPVTVVLLTDGEETCGGDPAAEIQALQDAGFDVRVNVVGLKIDDEALKTEFARWAELGGGEYFDVSADSTALQTALTAAMSVPYTVQDAAGTSVATGIVGADPIILPSGEYTLVIGNSERPITITPDETTQIIFGQ